MSDAPKMLECQPVSERMKHLGPSAYFEESKARELVASGDVVIKGEEEPVYETPPAIQVDIGYLKRDRFSVHKQLTKVAWVQDMSKMGGAELSNCVVVNAGTQCGFDIVGVTPARFNEDILNECDIIILNNCMQFTPEQFHKLRYHLHERTTPFVKYEHDYREFKRQNVSAPFFLQSRLNIFISPDHLKRHMNTFGGDVAKRSCVLPLAIDTALFNPCEGAERPLGTVLVPNYKKCGENVDDFMKSNAAYKYAVIGQVAKLPALEVEHLPRVTNDQMPKYYSRFEKMVHLPYDSWAGERIIFEAALCGCEVVTNKNAGHMSWKYDLSDRVSLKKELDEAPFTFWKEIEQCLSRL